LTLAAALASELGLRPGACVLRGDITRRLLSGIARETKLPDDAYTRKTSRPVYDELGRKAAMGLKARYSVIIDAVALRQREWRSFAEVALSASVPFSGLWLEAPAHTMAERVRRRRHDASDATAEIVAEQARHDPRSIDWIRIDAGGQSEDSLAAARRALATS